MTRIAVLVVHGVEIDAPGFADTPIHLLQEEFARALGQGAPDADEALVFGKAHLAPVLEDQQRVLFEKECPGGSDRFFAQLRHLVERMNAGSPLAMVPMGADLLRREDRALKGVHYPTARWIMAHFVGDAIAYQITPSSREIYDQIHRAYAEALEALARRAGGGAPLCVVAHSFGTIVSSDFFYDRETERRTGRALPPFHRLASTPLERGETLVWLYTMGSPMALWSLRYPAATLSAPIAVPAPEMQGRVPGGEWVNLIDEDDLFAWPLQPLGPEYARAVQDRRVKVKAGPFGWTPLVHPFYWADRDVMAPIARRLADAYRALRAEARRAAG